MSAGLSVRNAEIEIGNAGLTSWQPASQQERQPLQPEQHHPLQEQRLPWQRREQQLLPRFGGTGSFGIVVLLRASNRRDREVAVRNHGARAFRIATDEMWIERPISRPPRSISK